MKRAIGVSSMKTSWFGKSLAGGADGIWAKSAIVTALKRRFGLVEHLGDDEGFAFYGVVDNELRFVVALVEASGAPDSIVEIGFLARFSGYPVSDGALDAMNRNLHLSVAARDSDGDVYLIGGVRASGRFDEGTFGLILDAWRRDLLVVVQAVTGEGLVAAFPAARFEAARRFAANLAPSVPGDGDGQPGPARSDALATFLGASGSSTAACGDCGGRGRIGFIARSCRTCDGTGFVRGAQRR